MGIFPPNVQRTGLASALSDLAAPAEARGIEVLVDVPPDLDLPAGVESLLFQCAQESMRNVVTHAGADSVDLRVAANGRKVVMEIDDDGVGFSADDHAEARSEGHLGLHILEDLIRDARGTFSVTSRPGEGTRIRLEVPLR